MRKITDFIIEKRNYVLPIFIILSLFCLYLSTKVNINYDLTEYLPSTSETRIGMDIMNKEFGSLPTSSLNVMFKDLSTEDKLSIKDALSNIDGVSSVSYDTTNTYNKDNYTLYQVSVSGESDSTNAANVYKTIKSDYKDYEVYLSASTSEGFGLTLMEAIGSGLPIIGFDVPYGNQNFVRDGGNGYLLPTEPDQVVDRIARSFAEMICLLYQSQKMPSMRQASYARAEDFLTSKVEKAWSRLIEEVTHAERI